MLTTLVYSTVDPVSLGVAGELKSILGFSEEGSLGRYRQFRLDNARLLEADVPLFKADEIDGLVDGPILFISRHASAGGVGSFTAHSTGNWSASAVLGGEPMRLSAASPERMLSVLRLIGSVAVESATYEATHHGPLTRNPSLFVELGGNPSFADSLQNRKMLASAIAGALENGFEAEYDKVAIGIGGTHYPRKFTRLALEGRYAFGHMMPNYAINADMIANAVECSDVAVERAVVEWKS
ncbi:MAG: hypothetical protein KGH58_03950, partial [Candidatus Micrarchaeota archaeon]|nr:hypothetical protein [Candidatus Micrarchaeota archaeon]